MNRRLIKIAASVLAVLMLATLMPVAALAAAPINLPGTVVFPPNNPNPNNPQGIRRSGTMLPASGCITLVVTDAETELPIEGAKYQLYRVGPGGKDKALGDPRFTGKDGKITVSHMTTGQYYWKAAADVEGYAPDTEKHLVTTIGCRFTTVEVALEKPKAPNPAILGSWILSDDFTVTDELKAMFDKGLEGLLGVSYDPLILLGTQLVSGTNYCFLCEATVVAPNAEPYYACVFLYKDLEGNVSILDIVRYDELVFDIDLDIDSLLTEAAISD